MTVRRVQNCPRCGGNLFIYRDVDGWYEECLQCSFSRELSGPNLRIRLSGAKRPGKRVAHYTRVGNALPEDVEL